MLKTILVPLSGTPSDGSALAAAFQVAHRHGAHVDGLFVRPDPRDAVPFLADGMSGQLMDGIMRAAEVDGARRASAAKEIFDRACVQAGAVRVDGPPLPGQSIPGGLSARFVGVTGRPEDRITRAGRLNDLAVFAQGSMDEDPSFHIVREAALMGSGRPVLMVPRSPDPVVGGVIGRAVAVAWNGGRESARAVASAMPFLHGAGRILVLTAETSATQGLEAERLRDYLAWHGLKADTMLVTPTGPVGAALMDHARRAGCDLLVMGGYGHSRLREMILGGVTSWVMDHGGLPVLINH